MTETAGTAAGEAVGESDGEAAGASDGAAVKEPAGSVAAGSVPVAVAVASWLDASEGEIVCVELKPFPERTSAPRALLLVSRKAAVGPARI